MIIEVAGIDGAGKSTLTKWIADTWNIPSCKVQPYNEDFWKDAEIIEGVFGTRAIEYMKAAAIARALLAEAARLREKKVVFDRYTESAQMYWHVKDIYPVPLSFLDMLPKPDIVVFLDIDPDIALLRRARPSEKNLQEEHLYLEKCASYLREKAQSSAWRVIDATLPLDQVKSEIGYLMANMIV